MAYLYMRITKAEDSADEAVAPLLEVKARHPFLQHTEPDRVTALAAKHGYEIVPAEWLPYNPREWPLTAIVYVTTAHGSRCSQTQRLPVRRKA